MPDRTRARELAAEFNAKGDPLARGRDPEEDPGHVPWRLTHAELAAFSRAGLQEVSFEDYLDPQERGVRKFRASYRRP
jgi:hypothetical protein